MYSSRSGANDYTAINGEVIGSNPIRSTNGPVAQWIERLNNRGIFSREDFGDVAQLRERCIRTAEVGSLSLLVSTNILNSSEAELTITSL
jgi:hypothetical protein